MSQRETPPDKEYVEYDPVEGVGGFCGVLRRYECRHCRHRRQDQHPRTDAGRDRQTQIRHSPLLVGPALDALAIRHRRIFTEVIC